MKAKPVKKLLGMGFSPYTIKTMSPRHFKELTGVEKSSLFFRRRTARPKVVRAPMPPARVARRARRDRSPRAQYARALEDYDRGRRVKARKFFRSDLFDKKELDPTLKGRTHRGESFDEIYRKYLYGDF